MSKYSESYREMLYRSAGNMGAGRRNWRLPVFGAVFIIAAVAGLIYTYSRPAEYRAIAKLTIIPAEKPPADANEPVASNGKGPDAFLTEVEFLTSRPALEELHGRLVAAGFAPLLSGADGVEALKRMISAHPESGTQIVELWAVGERNEILAPALNQLMAIYAAQRGEEFVSASADERAQTEEELAKYAASVAGKRKELENFRARYGIVSQERDENPAVARARGLGSALNAAQERAVNAQAKLRAIKAAIASGKAPTRAKDNPNLGAIEQRLAQAREQLSELERRYTQNYLKHEPEAVKLQKLIPVLESQLAQEKETSLQANLADAEQEAAQAQDALDRLKGQQAAEESSLQTFSSRFGEYKVLQEQLGNLETMQRRTAERLVRMEAREISRKPQFKIIEAAALPQSIWRPDYNRDAAIALATALGLGFLAAWLVEFLLAPRPEPFNVIVAPTPIAYPMATPTLIGESSPALIDAGPAQPQLPAPPPAVRELNDAELRHLIDAAEEEARLALVGLLSGVSPDEIVEMRWADIDPEAQLLRISRPAPREIPIGAAIARWLGATKQNRQGQTDDRLLKRSANGIGTGHLEAIIAYAAHDAALENPAEITPAAIRHTYIAFLVRQGIRFSDLARIVGPLPADVTAMYGTIATSGNRRSLEPDERVMPSLRELGNVHDR